MIIGHFVPSYRPICDGLSAQLLREQDTLAHRLGYDYRYWAEETSDIVVLRNRALKRAIEMGCDYLCMQDSDIWSKSSIGAIAVMLETARKTGAAMTVAICGLRRTPAVSNVEPVRAGEVYKGIKAGTGLVLIDCKQAATIEGRWFDREYSEDGADIMVGEDIWFCRQLAKHNLELWVDGRVPTTHAKRDVVSLDYPGAATASGNSRPATQLSKGAR